MNLQEHGLTPKFPPVLDATMVKDFMYCPSYFYLRHVLGLVKKQYDSVEDAGKDWGIVWHKVQEAYTAAITDSKDKDEAIHAGLLKIEPWPRSLRDDDRHGRTKMRMAQIFLEYVDRFWESDAKQYEPLRFEQIFDIYDEEFGIRWSGRIDRVVRKIRGNKIILWDHKTTAWMTRYYFEQHEFSFQIPGYVRMLNGALTEQVDEAMIDVLYVLKNSHDFLRRTIHVPPQRSTEWATNVRNILNYMYYLRDRYLDNPDAWVKNWNHCTSWNRACTFADIHWIDPSPNTRLRILASDYIVDRWSPAKEDEG